LNKTKGKKKAKTPIINAIYDILYDKKDPKKIFKSLTEKLN
jgi:glycerol-3-phosphate dehydrogenase (NAD(P)+)